MELKRFVVTIQRCVIEEATIAVVATSKEMAIGYTQGYDLSKLDWKCTDVEEGPILNCEEEPHHA